MKDKCILDKDGGAGGGGDLLLENRRVNSQLCLRSIRALKTTETKGEAGVKAGQID